MKQRGFTLIELLVVMSIIAILVSMSMAGVLSVRAAAKRNQTEALLGKVDAALRRFRIDVGFYPKGYANDLGLKYETAGLNRGIIQRDSITGLPISDNDGVWTSGTTQWRVGNGLMTSLGTRMSISERNTALTNAEAMRKIENERFYHIGNFCDFTCADLAKPGGWIQGKWSVTAAAYKGWAYVDPTGTNAATLGEKDLRRIFDHFRFAPTDLNRGSPWSASVHGDETGVGTSKAWTQFTRFTLALFQEFLAYARPRDAADAYQRALRDGVSAGGYTFDSQYDDSLVASAAGVALNSRTITLTGSSQPWHGDYLADLEPRYVKDVDGDGHGDIIDAYGNPLIYACEGMPAGKQIMPRTAALDGNPYLGWDVYWGDGRSPNSDGVMLLYHPDPDLESATYINPNTVFSFITDRPNSKGVAVRPDAFDVSLLSSGGGGNGSGWIFAKYGIDTKACGDPYLLAGTLVPSRMRIMSKPVGTRAGDPYYCLSPDGSSLVEPFIDLNGNGVWDPGEVFVDRNQNGSYDSAVAGNDIRLCAPSGEEREFELLSAGRDGRFHAVRTQAVNFDNIRARVRR